MAAQSNIDPYIHTVNTSLCRRRDVKEKVTARRNLLHFPPKCGSRRMKDGGAGQSRSVMSP